MLGSQRLFQRAGKAAGDGAAVEAQCAALRQLLRQKRGDGGHVGLAHAYQLNAAARQLIRRLQEVAAVGPQGRAVRQHHQRTSGAGEAGQIGPRLEVVAHIFRAVEVVCDHHVAVHAVLSHAPAQLRQAFRYDHSKSYRLSRRLTPPFVFEICTQLYHRAIKKCTPISIPQNRVCPYQRMALYKPASGGV